MTFVRVLGTIGRAFIALGVFTLLFAAFQLWGTGLLEARAQNGLENEYDEFLAEIEAEAAELGVQVETIDPESSSPAPGIVGGDVALAAEAGAAAPAAEVEAGTEADIFELRPELLWRDNGDTAGLITIPDIGVAKYIVEGVGVEDLRKGPGHYPGTPLPGMPGNAAIAGHRTTYGAPFHRLDELEPGDAVFAVTPQGQFEYRVVEQPNGQGHFIVSPDRIDVLSQDFTEHPNRLTLTACHPKFSAAQRIVVVAELVSTVARYIPAPAQSSADDVDLAGEEGLPGDPDLPGEPADEAEPESPGADEQEAAGGAGAATGPAEPPADEGSASAADLPVAVAASPTGDDFGEGLEGDRGAIFPAVLWGLAAAAIWAAASFVGRRWRRWPPYVVAVMPFAVVLFVCYMHIDKALPSY